MIGYCGTGYNGMQIQNNPDVKTIEGELFKAFAKAGAISPENADDLKKNSFMRSARTDKGVHAAGNVISCKLIVEDEDIREKINKELPDQIRIWGIERTNKSFDCRKMCSSRIYEYLLPTYSLLPPKPNSVLAELVKEKNEEDPTLLREDIEGDDWWKETVSEITNSAGITADELKDIQNKINQESQTTSEGSIVTTSITENNDSIQINPMVDSEGNLTDLGKKIRAIKDVENRRRRSYRILAERLDLFRDAMKQYEGTNNFHNFTLGKPFKDASAKRYMKSTSVSAPFIIEGTEWVSIKIHGQSFMLHQIRKMISMACLVLRTGCPISRISDCFAATKINIPKAPALGLLLEAPVFEAYNERLEKFGYNSIDFSKYQEEMDAFKMKYIYDKIYAEEVKDNVFHGFFNFIDTFKGYERDTKEGTHIFDFLKNMIKNEAK